MVSFRGWIAGAVAAVLVIAAVLAATELQRATSDTNFKEAQAAGQMQVAMLSQERGLDRFLADERPGSLQLLFEARLQLTNALKAATKLASDDPLEQAQIDRQASAFQRWSALATTAILRKQSSRVADTAQRERERSRVIDAFLIANNAYQDRLVVNRHAEERSAALFPIWVLLGLGALFLAIGALVTWRKRQTEARAERLSADQSRFAEAIQFADSEYEAHELVAKHLERSLPGSDVLVLNRNNSLDRLTSSRPLPESHPLSSRLQSAQPRSCLAVRLSRRYERGDGDAAEALSCGICGGLSGPSSCQPLLVGGEVIGSVLIAHDDRLSSETDTRLQQTVNQAAPVLANLRNLAIAERQALTDALTGLPNRRAIDDTLRQMVARAGRTISPLSVALLDLDHFKQINDNYGHDRGDDALAALSALLRSELRASDFAGRNGGEEFVLFLPDTDQPGAALLANKLRESISSMTVPGIDRTITTSIGIATYPGDASTPEDLMRLADRNLYSAKQLGRDRVEVTSRSEAHDSAATAS